MLVKCILLWNLRFTVSTFYTHAFWIIIKCTAAKKKPTRNLCMGNHDTGSWIMVKTAFSFIYCCARDFINFIVDYHFTWFAFWSWRYKQVLFFIFFDNFIFLFFFRRRHFLSVMSSAKSEIFGINAFKKKNKITLCI